MRTLASCLVVPARMESEEYHKKWPLIGQSDVADFCREICESIIGLERAFEAGELSSRS